MTVGHISPLDRCSIAQQAAEDNDPHFDNATRRPGAVSRNPSYERLSAHFTGGDAGHPARFCRLDRRDRPAQLASSARASCEGEPGSGRYVTKLCWTAPRSGGTRMAGAVLAANVSRPAGHQRVVQTHRPPRAPETQLTDGRAAQSMVRCPRCALSCWSRETATWWRCTLWRSAMVGTSSPKVSRSWRWAGSPTRGHSRRDSARTGLDSRLRDSTTPRTRPSSSTGWPQRVSALRSRLTDRLLWASTSAGGSGGRAHPALGVEAVEAVIEAAGEVHSLRLLAGMPAQRVWTREAVLRRFLGVRSGARHATRPLLVEALEPSRVPEPLTAVLARV